MWISGYVGKSVSTVADPFRASRQFERMIFGGVPEHPEPNAERQAHEHASTRVTGRSPHGCEYDVNAEAEGILIASIVYDDATCSVEYRYPSDAAGVR